MLIGQTQRSDEHRDVVGSALGRDEVLSAVGASLDLLAADDAGGRSEATAEARQRQSVDTTGDGGLGRLGGA